jgi:cell wall-associated NlpC family hydrolase
VLEQTALRIFVIREAQHWIGTKFSMNACLRGVGVDCGRFPYAVYHACGIDVPVLPNHWPRDFMCHSMADAEPYLSLIQQKLSLIDTPLPGDLAVFKPLRSRCYSHAAIVVEWPRVVHARGVGSHPQVEEGSADQWPLAGSQVLFFSPFNDTQEQ